MREYILGNAADVRELIKEQKEIPNELKRYVSVERFHDDTLPEMQAADMWAEHWGAVRVYWDAPRLRYGSHQGPIAYHSWVPDSDE